MSPTLLFLELILYRPNMLIIEYLHPSMESWEKTSILVVLPLPSKPCNIKTIAIYPLFHTRSWIAYFNGSSIPIVHVEDIVALVASRTRFGGHNKIVYIDISFGCLDGCIWHLSSNWCGSLFNSFLFNTVIKSLQLSPKIGTNDLHLYCACPFLKGIKLMDWKLKNNVSHLQLFLISKIKGAIPSWLNYINNKDTHPW